MSMRAWVEEAPVSRSVLLGAFFGTSMYFMPMGSEITIMVAMFMPGVYWAFAFVLDGTLEILQETAIMLALAYFYFGVCLVNVNDQPLYAPLSILVHGIIDWFHHFRLPPSSAHVKACCPHYPVICGCFDFAGAAVMGLLMLLFR